jgi:GntR family transcriptional regulator, transcriptional repressor for pyruvate dehydrogenase complex
VKITRRQGLIGTARRVEKNLDNSDYLLYNTINGQISLQRSRAEKGQTVSSIIKRQNIYQQLVEHLQQYIIDNALRPGDRLPTEAELADRFRVSRQSVREAVKVLESVGVVETRPRDGSRLKKMDTQHLTDHLRFIFELDGATVKEMAATRRVIEAAFVPIVVENADETDFQRMEAAIARMREHTQRGETFAEADIAFHQAIARATKNRVMAGFGVMLQEFFVHLRPRILADEAKQRQSIAEHEQIVQALRSKDIEAAQSAIAQHLRVYDDFD